MTEYQGIIERVRAATGADRGLDAELAIATGLLNEYAEPMDRYGSLRGYEGFGGKQAYFAPWWENGDGRHRWPPVMGDVAERNNVPAYTGSIDAALALAEKLLPGQQFRILDLAMMAIRAEFNRMTDNLNILRILPKYIILATLLALQSQEPK